MASTIKTDDSLYFQMFRLFSFSVEVVNLAMQVGLAGEIKPLVNPSVLKAS